jgi:hypothetical protein
MSTASASNDTTVGEAKRPVQISFDVAAACSPRPRRPLCMWYCALRKVLSAECAVTELSSSHMIGHLLKCSDVSKLSMWSFSFFSLREAAAPIVCA